MRMDARPTGHDRHRHQYPAGKAAKHTHGRDKGKRDARMIPAEISGFRDSGAMTALHFCGAGSNLASGPRKPLAAHRDD